MLPSEEEDFLDTRLVTINGGHPGYHRNNGGHSSDSNTGSNTTITLSRADPYLHIPPPPATAETEAYKSPLVQTSAQLKWSRGADSLASCWAFTLSLHSVIYLPEAVLRHGGVVFLVMYLFLLVILGLPLLLLEIFTGQYSTLPAGRLYRHLCPLLSGLGVSLAILCGLRCVLDLGVATWSSHGLVTMFRDQEVASLPHNAGYSLSSLDNLGEIVPYNVAALAAVTTLTFVLVAAGPRAIGKISLAVVPLCYGLLITLVIRACMDASGPAGFLAVMRPQWAALASVTAWLEAAAHVIFSLQLGLGVLTTYGGYNKFGHSLVRDSCIIIFGHFCWVILSVLLVFSLRGVADSAGILQLPVPAAESVAPNSSAVARAVSVSVLGESVGVSTVVLALETLATLQHGWLWAALFSVLLVLVCLTNMLGYVEMVSTSISHHRPLLARFKPLVSLIIILSAGLVAVCFSTLGGVHVFSLLHSYISDWPLLLVTVLTTLAGTHCMSMSSVLKFLSIMSRRKLTNFTKSHLSVILVTVVPIFISASLGWSLYVLSVKSQQPGSLPASWGLPVAWSLSALVVLPLLAGTLWYLTLAARGQIWVKHVRSILKPTSTWHRNQQLHYFGEDQTKIQSLAHS